MSRTISQAAYPCPYGYLIIRHCGNAVCEIRIAEQWDFPQAPGPVSDLAATQILEYLAGNRKEFDFPMMLTGTPFQQSVWSALSRIPYGEVRTYGQIAQAIGRPGAARAVGQACNRNPLWIAIPCHRVIGRNSALTGYAGGISLKQALLKLEQEH